MSNDALEKSIAELQAQVAALTARLSQMQAPPAAVAAPTEISGKASDEEAIPEEILLAISAAVAAYLGERAHIRAVRLVSTTRWSQEGRVSIQASHRLQRG